MLENGKNVLGSIIQLHVAVGEFECAPSFYLDSLQKWYIYPLRLYILENGIYNRSGYIFFENGIYNRPGYIYYKMAEGK